MGDFWNRKVLCLCLFVVSDGMSKVHHGMRRETNSGPPKYPGLTDEPSTETHSPKMVSRRHLGRRQLDDNFFGDQQQNKDRYDLISGPETRPSYEGYDPQGGFYGLNPQRQRVYDHGSRGPKRGPGYSSYDRPPRNRDFNGIFVPRKQSDFGFYDRPPRKQEKYNLGLRNPKLNVYDRPPRTRGLFGSQERSDFGGFYGRPPQGRDPFGHGLRVPKRITGYNIYDRPPNIFFNGLPHKHSGIGVFDRPPPKHVVYGHRSRVPERKPAYYLRAIPQNEHSKGFRIHVPQKRLDFSANGIPSPRRKALGRDLRELDRGLKYRFYLRPPQRNEMNESSPNKSKRESQHTTSERPPHTTITNDFGPRSSQNARYDRRAQGKETVGSGPRVPESGLKHTSYYRPPRRIETNELGSSEPKRETIQTTTNTRRYLSTCEEN